VMAVVAYVLRRTTHISTEDLTESLPEVPVMAFGTGTIFGGLRVDVAGATT
jgi:hypothetical protein